MDPILFSLPLSTPPVWQLVAIRSQSQEQVSGFGGENVPASAHGGFASLEGAENFRVAQSSYNSAHDAVDSSRIDVIRMHITGAEKMTSQTLKHTSQPSVSPSGELIRCWDSFAFGPVAPMSTLGNGIYAARPEANLDAGAKPGG